MQNFTIVDIFSLTRSIVGENSRNVCRIPAVENLKKSRRRKKSRKIVSELNLTIFILFPLFFIDLFSHNIYHSHYAVFLECGLYFLANAVKLLIISKIQSWNIFQISL